MISSSENFKLCYSLSSVTLVMFGWMHQSVSQSVGWLVGWSGSKMSYNGPKPMEKQYSIKFLVQHYLTLLQ